jgi:hypothetical protein
MATDAVWWLLYLHVPIIAVVIIPIVGAVFKAEINFPGAACFDFTVEHSVVRMVHEGRLGILPLVKSIMEIDRLCSRVTEQSLVVNTHIVAMVRRVRFYIHIFMMEMKGAEFLLGLFVMSYKGFDDVILQPQMHLPFFCFGSALNIIDQSGAFKHKTTSRAALIRHAFLIWKWRLAISRWQLVWVP